MKPHRERSSLNPLVKSTLLPHSALFLPPLLSPSLPRSFTRVRMHILYMHRVDELCMSLVQMEVLNGSCMSAEGVARGDSVGTEERGT